MKLFRAVDRNACCPDAEWQFSDRFYDDDSRFFDKTGIVDITDGGNLPHWHQEGKILFVTFRLGDSLPQKVLSDLKMLIDDFKRHIPEPWDMQTKRRYWMTVGRREEQMLHKGLGS